MEQAVQGRARKYARRPKKWAAKNAKDRCKCGQSTNFGALRSKIRCESNSRRIEYEYGTVRQIVKEDLGMRKFPQKWCLESWHTTRNIVGFTFNLIFYTTQICLIGSLPVKKRGVFNTTRKPNGRTCSGKHRIHLGRKKYVCLGRRSRKCLCVSSITKG